MTRHTVRLVPLAALAAAFAALPAAAQSPSAALVLEFAVEMGGDRFGETLFEDGSTQTMYAGQGGTLAVGGELRPSASSPLALRATAGYKFVTTKATNADIFLGRVPLELVGSYTFPNDVRLGAGVVRHTAIRFNGGGIGPDVDFEDANGFTVEAGWRWAALTYTAIEYADEQGNRFDASNAGLSLSVVLRR